MASFEVNAIAAEIVAISAKLAAMYEDSTKVGGHADQNSPGADTAKNTQWRESMQRERARLIRQLYELGYSLDENGTPVSNTFEIVTEATT